jgi:alcohol dehydrogenase class IV
MSAPTANWSYPTAVRFGPGRIKELADACRAAGVTRPLLVTDAGLAKLPITTQALGLLKVAGLPVATTAGTGSEVGRAGVVTQEATHTKKVIFHPKMMPRVVICDPELTVGMPPSITMGTGMDALAHCLSFPRLPPLAEGIAVEGMRPP